MPIELFFDLLLYGSILTLALYHLVLFALKRKQLSMLLLGSLCLVAAFFCMMSVERSFITLYPTIGLELAVKLKYISLYLCLSIFTVLISNLYPLEFPRITLWIILGINAFFTLVTFSVNAGMHTYVIWAYGTIALVLSGYIIFISFKASLILLLVRNVPAR